MAATAPAEPAIGASAMAAADAPAKSNGVRVFIFAFMQKGLPTTADLLNHKCL